MATEADYREVRFDRYCYLCKHLDKNGYESPCEECMDTPLNLYSARPVNWVCIKLTVDQAYKLLKEELIGYDFAYSEYIIKLVGEDCFNNLKNKGYLKLVNVINKRDMYVLVDERTE